MEDLYSKNDEEFKKLNNGEEDEEDLEVKEMQRRKKNQINIYNKKDFAQKMF